MILLFYLKLIISIIILNIKLIILIIIFEIIFIVLMFNQIKYIGFQIYKVFFLTQNLIIIYFF
jgi:hypothetical protein